MNSMFSAWRESLRFFFSASSKELVLLTVHDMVPRAIRVILILGFFVGLAYLNVPFISSFLRWVLSAPVPIVAMLTSPLYVVPLIRQYEKTNTQHFLSSYLLSGAIFYGVIGASAWGWYVVQKLLSLKIIHLLLLWAYLLFAPLGIFLFIVSPFVTLGYVYKPLSRCSHKEIWRHGIMMSWYELPLIIILLLGMMPIGYLLYHIPSWCAQNSFFTTTFAHYITHICSVLYWLLGWALCIVFYQKRKQIYFKSGGMPDDCVS